MTVARGATQDGSRLGLVPDPCHTAPGAVPAQREQPQNGEIVWLDRGSPSGREMGSCEGGGWPHQRLLCCPCAHTDHWGHMGAAPRPLHCASQWQLKLELSWT